MPRYKAPEGVAGINIGGQQFNADSNGIITIPDDGNYNIPEGYTRAADASPVAKENATSAVNPPESEAAPVAAE